ncbi:MAG: septum formation initiator family protein [Myxococcales bacterium]|nr:septum formation initiator family protein [Myxococcales bacterium]MCB9547944.1 septum formation initiator family protein [Myxococcales bacterium]
MKRRLIRLLSPVALLAVLVGGVYGFSQATLNPELAAYNQSLREELLRVEARNGQLAESIAELKAEIQRLRSDDAESLFHARTQLGMVRTGEVVYQLAAPPAVEKRADQAPR